jgi:hypothetical protein
MLYSVLKTVNPKPWKYAQNCFKYIVRYSCVVMNHKPMLRVVTEPTQWEKLWPPNRLQLPLQAAVSHYYMFGSITLTKWERTLGM